MIYSILVASLLIVLSIIIHAMATRFVMFLAIKRASGDQPKPYMKEIWISIIVLIMFGASLVETLLWASTYVFIGAIAHFEEALYFSIVTFTTLGYGDIVLSEGNRLLASLEAANGIIIFGWSTAIIMAVVQRLYFKSNKQ